ncbi:unnamed protein product [Cylindrotheca closterium]|uniref:Hexose transporter 1 n=1 Tax=Cylindrotheca closterium TaxID=2856 RepID=A0AAD2CCH3_9STRA|nr:unnamed protein product [Cylindrotheca closterium]
MTDSPHVAGEYHIHGEQSHNGSLKITQYTYLLAFCAALNSCNLGYDIGVSTNVGPMIEEEFGLSSSERELFIGSLNLWSIFGSSMAHWICDTYGRRSSFIVAALFFIVGVIIMGLSNSYAILMIGRFLVGLGVGFGLAIDPIYIAEVTPAQYRGELVTWSEIGINVGIVLGFATGFFFYGYEQSIQWRLMLWMGAVLPLVMIVLVLTVMPESPRWLIKKGREQEARQILERLYPPGNDISAVMNEIKEALDVETRAKQDNGWDVILYPTKAVRRMLLVGVGIAIAQQLVGVDAIQNYLIDLLKESGIDSDRGPLEVLMVLGLLKLGFVFVGGKLFDTRGRRPLFLISLAGMALSLTIIAYSNETMTIVGLALYLSFFSIGMGPGAWLIPSEVFATSIRAKAMSAATICNRVAATVLSSTFLTASEYFGWTQVFLMLAGICILLMIFVYFFLPETKGRSLEDMSKYFAQITNDTSLIQAEIKLSQSFQREYESFQLDHEIS